MLASTVKVILPGTQFMATEVLQGFNDFVLFPQQRDDALYNAQFSCANGSFDQPYSDMASNFAHDFNGFGGFYDPYGQDSSVAPAYYGPPRSLADDHVASSKTGTSASPSVSLSQSLEHIPSNFSHTSAASGQSTASSAVGSPYSQHQNLPAGQDQWVEMGLGIGGNLSSTDMLPPGAYQLTSSEPERVAFDDKFASSFVGESPQAFHAVSSASPTVSSSVSCSPFSEPSSAVSPVTAISPDLGKFPNFENTFYSTPAVGNGQAAGAFTADAGSVSATQAFPSSPFPSSQQHRPSQNNNSFFAQSSGNFVAPLESSCRFSFTPSSCTHFQS